MEEKKEREEKAEEKPHKRWESLKTYVLKLYSLVFAVCVKKTLMYFGV